MKTTICLITEAPMCLIMEAPMCLIMEIPTSHHGGSHMSHHECHNKSHHGGSHMSHHGGSHMSHHGGSHMSHHGDQNKSHHAGSHMSHHGGSNKSHHGGSHMTHGGSHHMSHHGSNKMSHHGNSHTSHNGSSHMSHGRSHIMSHHGGHPMSHHEGHHMSHHGGHHMSHHGSHHVPHYGGHHMSHYGGHHMSHHGGHNKSQQGGQYVSHQGSHHMSHHGGHHMSPHGGSHMSHHGSSHTSHHKSPHVSHHGGHYISHHGGHISNHEDHHTSNHGSSQKSHLGSHHKKEVSFSKYVSHGHKDHSTSFGHHNGLKADGLFEVNEKEIMQLLNERLSSYLNTVRSLEMENAQLERKICEWYENNPPKTPPDGSQYFKIIDGLQSQIMEASMENAYTMLQMDNARLAAAEYRSKYELELTQSNNAEMDVNNLERVLEGLNGETSNMEMHVQSLQGEMNSLKNNSEEEIESLLSQLGPRINMEMNAAPSIDLNEALSDIREEYENLMERNLKEAEDMFLQMNEELSREVASSSEELQSIETEFIEKKLCVQALEIELQSELSLISALEGTLAETEATFGSKLSKLQCLINNMESELATIRSNLERQNHEYKALMDQKTHLEMEIATYKRLLDGHEYVQMCPPLPFLEFS
ncbi:keratin, type I cytoskeletal 19-like [Rhinoderma darwinii]|uniref:keratin, type I cytoskeletal 19-like n=1 Tax=Rhinoderma darwinii TaxID=43563 RepID=UPI003F67445D